MAIVLLAIAFTSFHAHALLTIRQIADSGREAAAASLVQRRAETTFTTPCSVGAGIDSAPAVVSHWSSRTVAPLIHLDIRTTYQSAYALRTESYSTAGVCQ